MAIVAGTFQISGQARIQNAQINPQGTAANITLTKPSDDIIGTGLASFAFGTGTGQCDIYCAADYDLTPGGTVELDLFTGTDFKDLFAGAAAQRKLRGMFAGIISGGDASGVVIGGAALNAHPLWFGTQADTWTIFPSGPPFLGGSAAGVTVDATHKQLLFTNAGAVATTVRLILGATSA